MVMFLILYFITGFVFTLAGYTLDKEKDNVESRVFYITMPLVWMPKIILMSILQTVNYRKSKKHSV